MEENYDILIETLEKSVKKNGEIQLTNKHLLNILKLVRKQVDNDGFLDATEADIY